MRLLVVEDDFIALEMLSSFLSAQGHEVETARDGEEGWQKILQSKPNLVITDWEMPRLDGLGLCRRVREGDLGRYVYLIVLTANKGAENIVAGMEAGADDFVTKPFNPDELRMRIRAAERVLALETRDLAIFAMAKLAESRDTETGAHLERMQAYCKVISEYLRDDSPYASQMRGDFVSTIVSTSPLHDIGKVGIPDSILLKPGRLSPDEFLIMQQHTTIGGDTLRAAVDAYPGVAFLKTAYDIAIAHHERWDGRGYPLGLSGEEIPLTARIVTVADVYDAITSKRVYKDPMSHLIAANIMREDSGKHFDPVVADAFEACNDIIIKTKELVNEEFADTAIHLPQGR